MVPPAAVATATYPLPRAHFTKESWTLEPPEVVGLLDKIKKNGIPLAAYAGVKPLYGIKTGLNEAFLIDSAKRDQLVQEDPGCADIIKPYLRGQDIERWWSPLSDLHMIALKSSSDHKWPWSNCRDAADAESQFKATYPALHSHMKEWESFVDPNSDKRRGLRYREDQGRFWWELRPCAYYEAFYQPKTIYQVIQFYPCYSVDEKAHLLNDKAFFLPTADRKLVAMLNSPVVWWFNWRYLTHLKDEALSPMAYMIERIPIAKLTIDVDHHVDQIINHLGKIHSAVFVAHDWLRHEFGLVKRSRI